jgi:hypothetical protein
MTDKKAGLRAMIERRRIREPFRIVERRSGFDRRNRRGVLHVLRDAPLLLIALLALLSLLSAADWALTLRALRHGAVEGNPLLGGLIAADPEAAAIFKAGIILVVSLMVWNGRRYRLVLATAVVGVALYALLVVYHLVAFASASAL